MLNLSVIDQDMGYDSKTRAERILETEPKPDGRQYDPTLYRHQIETIRAEDLLQCPIALNQAVVRHEIAQYI